MKTIGLVTYFNSDNYGAMLQAYALQREIERNNCRCLVVSHDRFGVKTNEFGKEAQRKRKRLVRIGIKYPRAVKMVLSAQTKKIRYGKQKQSNKCAFFREKFFQNRTEVFYYTSKQITLDPPNCDAFVCGSDQIWNPERFEGAEPFFLSFAPEGRERIAYAPSIAMTFIPDNLKKQYKALISTFSKVSVREKKGCEAIEKATGIRPEWVMDPTFLLSKEEWEAFSIVPNKLPQKYLLCYFLGKENLLSVRKAINKISKKMNAEVVVLPFGEHTLDQRWKSMEEVGPQEFVAIIREACYVLTDSFHGTVFSILMKKNFNVYAGSRTPTVKNRFDRIQNVLDITGLDYRKFTSSNDMDCSEINYESVDCKVSPMIEKSKRFLEQALSQVKKKSGGDPSKQKLASYESCTGCTACVSSCTHQALQMQQDGAGFWRPVMDSNKCVHCGNCVEHCPVRNPDKITSDHPRYLAVYALDKNFRKKGSSGNVFGLLARYMLNQDGEVFGAALSDNCRELRIQSATEVGLDRLQKSKYFEAEMGDVILRIKNLLLEGKKVLFTGTPCQVAGVRKALGNPSNLVLCDFICHGVPSSKWYGKYIDGLEEKYKSTVSNVAFRSKSFGWRLYCMKVNFVNGKQYLKPQYEDPWLMDFMRNQHLRTNCYSCNRILHSSADMTMGDYWAVKNKKNMSDTDEGISIVCLRTEKGRKYFEQASINSNDENVVFTQSLSEEEVNETIVPRVRGIPHGNDILPDKFIMKPKLSPKDILKKYYNKYIILKKRWKEFKV